MRSSKTVIQISVCGLVAVALIACGPLSPKSSVPESTSSSSNKATAQSQDLQSSGESLAYTEDQLFVVNVSPKNEDSPKPVIGSNQFVLRFLHGHDLSPISKNSQVTVDYVHMHAKIPATFDAKIEPQDDGSYLATVFFKKAGTWKLNIHVSEPSAPGSETSEVRDNYTLSLKF